MLVSIIGIDRFKGGYNAAKLAQERALLAGPIPTRIVRAAQFHEFVAQLLDWGRQGDVAYVPTMNTQVVAARTVAEVLAELATLPDSAPADRPTLEVAGPRAERLAELARTLVAHRGEELQVEETTEFFSRATSTTRTRRSRPGREAGRPDVRGMAEGLARATRARSSACSRVMSRA